ncbi:hypothetical protein V1514DRAFT_339741 [Lipomyces japonicus]|uniref:uncharacterized protein n=1 Tax=Lipomyces japonicus TaxID=56871 RepID=UPI0034CD273F
MTGGPVPIAKKYTLRSTGIWEKIRKLLVLVPNRSTGNPLVSVYRVPSTGSRPESERYVDPATLPASDISNNPYYKRDVRRAYPRVQLFSQSDISGLLLHGNAAAPRIARGAEGEKALAEVKRGDLSLTDTIKLISTDVVNEEVLKNGLPPFPGSFNKDYRFRLLDESESGLYTEKYPVRAFT